MLYLMFYSMYISFKHWVVHDYTVENHGVWTEVEQCDDPECRHGILCSGHVCSVVLVF